MKTVWKYPLTGPDKMIDMPEDAMILHVGWQDGNPAIWARVDSELPTIKRHFYVVGTGHELPHNLLAHLGTVFEGPFVWHVFEAPFDREPVAWKAGTTHE